jgi:hypothetical protein
MVKNDLDVGELTLRLENTFSTHTQVNLTISTSLIPRMLDVKGCVLWSPHPMLRPF